MRIFLILILFGISTGRAANALPVDIYFHHSIEILSDSIPKIPIVESEYTLSPKAKKLKAILLAVFLGHFGVHRIYLGSSPNVPVVYSLTLGGGFGLLPLLDIVAILSSDNLEQYSNNNQVFMWSKSK